MKVLIIIGVTMSLLFLSKTNFVYSQDYDEQESDEGEYLGRYSSNPYDSQSVSNPYGQYGSQYSSQSVNNPYGQYGSPYSSKSVNNPYTTDAPKLYSQDGQYLKMVNILVK